MGGSGGSEQAQARRGSRARRVLAIGAVLLVLLASGVAVEIHALGLDRLPDVHAVMTNPLPTDTMVYDRTGAVLIADLHPGGYQHYRTPLQDMGRWLPAATDAETGSAMAQRLVRLRLGVGGPGTAAKIRRPSCRSPTRTRRSWRLTFSPCSTATARTARERRHRSTSASTPPN